MITYEEAKQMISKVDRIPYPQVVNIVPNKTYANMLYDDFSGELGELSAITQYIFEHIGLSQNKDISKILKSIAIMEMKHLDIVGDLIKRLGKEPIFTNSNGIQWSANNVNYKTRDLKETINFNIYTEKVAIEGYRKAQMYTKNKSLKSIFERIILDEKTHIEIFKKMI